MVKHHKKILNAWIVIVLLSVPAVSRVNDVLAYQESEMITGDIESLIAQSIVDEQFPTSLANSTLMIVLTGPNVSSQEVRDFCIELGDRVNGGELAYLQDFSSVYSVYEGMVYWGSPIWMS